MKNTCPNIFLSYSHKDSEIAKSIDTDLQMIQIFLTLDERELLPFSSIYDYMHQIGTSDYALLLVSDHFLRSEWCMYEVYNLIQSPNYQKRTMPIVLESAKIKNYNEINVYHEYWKKRNSQIEQEVAHIGDSSNIIRENEKQKIKNISDSFITFINLLINTKQVSLYELQSKGYIQILTHLSIPNDVCLSELLFIHRLANKDDQKESIEKFIEKYQDCQSDQRVRYFFSQRRESARYQGKSLLQHGRYIDIFVPSNLYHLSPEETYCSYQLRIEFMENEEVIFWFKNRYKCWNALQSHQNVVSMKERMSEENSLPCWYTKYLIGVENLDITLKRIPNNELTDDLILKILRVASDVCKFAHKNNICLQTLPLRHFLIDQSGELYLTGFDTAMYFTHYSFPAKYWINFSKDWKTLAPELSLSKPEAGPWTDIYALGILINRLVGYIELKYAALCKILKCIARHCLSDDPKLRFQSIDHFLYFLEKMKSKKYAPFLIEIPEGYVTILDNGKYVQKNVQKFSIGKYPVTNYEYDQFCSECSYPRRSYNEIYYSINDRLDAHLSPVVNVNLEDAENYCKWLSSKTEENYTLPTEAEWIRAAIIDHHNIDQTKIYPWGRDDPEYAHNKSAHGKKFRANFEAHYRGPTLVGLFEEGRSPSGCYDLGGNVWEWCSDYLNDKSPIHVLKGGSYFFSSDDMIIYNKRGALSTFRSPHVGFRIIKKT